MFPEITRDEVFRIETPHLWLRWPVRADADALAAVMAQGCRDGGARIAEANPCAIAALIARWRAEMEAGLALHLVLAPKGGGEPVGMVHAAPGAVLRCQLLADIAAEPLGAEATQALHTMTRWLGIAIADRRDRPMAQQRGLFLRTEFAGWCAPA